MCIGEIMNYCIAVFKSRSATLSFARLLKAHNIPCAIINTPCSIGHACGISVKFLSDDFALAQQLVSTKLKMSFSGFYNFNDFRML